MQPNSTLKVLRDWRALSSEDQGVAIAFGKFDGVHIGHQRVIDDAAQVARRLGVPLGVVSLEPCPHELFQPEAPPSRLMSASQRSRAVERLGVERLYLLPFDAAMAARSDRDFIEEVLVGGLSVRHVAVGANTSFGKNRAGNPEALTRYGAEYGFSVSIADLVVRGAGNVISSTVVRRHLREGRPDLATAILGRPFAIEGPVQKGSQLGRGRGFPTANIALGRYVAPRSGVYATYTNLSDGRRYPGVVSIGSNRDANSVEAMLQVTLFDSDQDLCGEVIEIELIAFLREEESYVDEHGHFSNSQAVDQMHRDIATARAMLCSTP